MKNNNHMETWFEKRAKKQSYMEKFSFSEQDIRKWKDEAFFLEGSRDVGVVLVHGWSSMPRQVAPVAKKINEAGYWVSAPCLSGHGSKPEDLEWAKGAHWVRDLRKAIDELKEKSGVSKVVVGGVSLGGNIAILAGEKIAIDGFIFFGTPVFLRNHFGIWCGLKIFSMFKKYAKKKYPNGIANKFITSTSYQYYPFISATESLKVIRKSLGRLRRINVPILVLQTNSDYLVSKLSPWILFNSIPSKAKKMQWVKTKHNRHVFVESDINDSISIIVDFIKKIERDY